MPGSHCNFCLLSGVETRRKIAQCERAADNRLSLILPTRQLSDRFENRIGPTSVEPVSERSFDQRR